MCVCVRFSCSSPTPSVKWERKDAPFSSSHATKERFDRWLEFASISESDDGEYTCTASNTMGQVTHSYTVTVEGNYTHTHLYTHYGVVQLNTCFKNFNEKFGNEKKT